MKTLGSIILAGSLVLFVPSAGHAQDTQVDTYNTEETSPGVSETYHSGSGQIDENGNGTINSYDDEGNQTGSTEIETSPSGGDTTSSPTSESEPDDADGD